MTFETQNAITGKTRSDNACLPLGIRLDARRVADSGKVVLGGRTPSLPIVRVSHPSTADKGKVKIGGRSPSL
jgi:hypothetical protein